VQQAGAGGVIEMRLDSLGGPVVSQIDIPEGSSTDPRHGWKEFSAPLSMTKGFHAVYFVFRSADSSRRHLFNLDWVRFRQ
jgi:cytochrome c